MNLGMAIKAIRTKAAISQSELAGRCGLSQTSLSQIEIGVKRPSQKTVEKICTELGIPETILHVLALEKSDIPQSRKGAYDAVYPSLKQLALELVDKDVKHLID